jgi:hypothetical protein
MSQTTSQSQKMTIGGLMAIIFFIAIILANTQSQIILPVWLYALLLVMPFLSRWILVPIGLHRKLRFTADGSYRRFDPEDPTIPEPIWSSIQALTPEIVALGFERVGAFRKDDDISGVASFATQFQHPRTRQVAQILGGIAAKSAATANIVLAFQTDFEDGTVLNSSNTRMPPFQPLSKRFVKGTMAFPEVVDPAQLFEIHQASLAHYAPVVARRTSPVADPLLKLKEEWDESFNGSIRKRDWWFDEESQCYRPTRGGAIRMGWQFLWPVKPILLALRRHRARRFLKTLGLAA